MGFIMNKRDPYSVLSGGLEICEGEKTLRVIPQLSEKEYASVKAIINRLGGKWNTSKKVFEFIKSPQALVDRVLLLGKKAINQFHLYPTPQNVFDVMAAFTSMADVVAGRTYKVLEPSCGFGGMACMIKEYFQSQGATAEITGYEIDPLNVLLAHEAGLDVTQVNFLTVKPEEKYDFVVMNPAFNGREFIKHIVHAQKFLSPNGKLISVVPVAEWLYQPQTDAERWLQECICFTQNSIIDQNDFFPSNTFDNAKIITTVIEIESVSKSIAAINSGVQAGYLLDMALIYLNNSSAFYERIERFKARACRTRAELLQLIEYAFYKSNEVVVTPKTVTYCVDEIADTYQITFTDTAAIDGKAAIGSNIESKIVADSEKENPCIDFHEQQATLFGDAAFECHRVTSVKTEVTNKNSKIKKQRNYIASELQFAMAI